MTGFELQISCGISDCCAICLPQSLKCSSLLFSSVKRRRSEVEQPLPLPQVRLLLHGHQQGRGTQTPASEDGLHQRGRLREVHADPVLPRQRVRAQRQADSLPLLKVPVRGSRPVPDGSSQVSARQRK